MGEGEVSGFFFASQVGSAKLGMTLYWSDLIKDRRLHLMYLKRVPDTSVSEVDQYKQFSQVGMAETALTPGGGGN